MKSCTQCRNQFEITVKDREFLADISPVFGGKKYTIQEPSLCPTCRAQRRMAWRGERKLYKRACDLCKKNIISMYRAEAKFPVYCSNCWWGDAWDPCKYGRDFDFSRPFFPQFKELCDKVPHFDRAVLESTMENSDYCNQAGYLKNCYLIVNSDQSEQCLYGKGINRCFDCVDGFKIYDCEACYEAVNVNNCAFCTYIIDSYNCSDCHYGANLIGCKHCFGCVNLRNKEYHIYNEQFSEAEYRKRIEEIKSQKPQKQLWNECLKLRKKHVIKWMREKQTENCTGDYLVQCKNCTECYDCEYLENAKYCSDLKKGDKVSFNNYDISYFGMGIDHSYECSVGGYSANHTLFCEDVWGGSNVYYSQFCMNGTRDCFGCAGLKKNSFSIFNKKYEPQEYEKLTAKIIEHMVVAGEYGEFFDAADSPFGYNESTAAEHFPLSREEVFKKGWNWYDEKEPDYSHVAKKLNAEKVPRDIEKIPDDIVNWALACEKTGRLFVIQKAELVFYRKMGLEIPTLHPDIRYENRLQLRTPRKLFERKCDKCKKEMKSTYAPDCPERVYCEQCYLKELY